MVYGGIIHYDEKDKGTVKRLMDKDNQVEKSELYKISRLFPLVFCGSIYDT